MTGAAVGTVPGEQVAPQVHPLPRTSRVVLAFLVLLTGVTLLLGYANKARCTGPEFDDTGRSTPDYGVRIERDVCYSDVQHLWIGRDIDQHVFPYVNGSITPDGQLVGGSVEYPVLTGLLIWGGALFAETDAGFLLGSALLMAPFGLVTGWLLGRLARWRALVWALGPPVVLYAFHNWDLPVVASAVAAVFAVHGWRTDRSLAQRGVVAGVLLGLGFALKLYPGAFVLPLALYVLTASRPGRLDWRTALRVPVAAGVTVVLVNVPFMLAGYEGWRASFTFQQLRKVDFTTNSIWFWGFRPESDPDNVEFQATMDWLSPTLVLLSFAVAVVVGWWRYRREGTYPWIGVSAAMLCGFLLLHKVHSPQYTLWLLPFFVLVQVPWSLVVAYLLADLAMGIGIFRWYYQLHAGLASGIYDGFAARRCWWRCSSCSCGSRTGSPPGHRRGAHRWRNRWPRDGVSPPNCRTRTLRSGPQHLVAMSGESPTCGIREDSGPSMALPARTSDTAPSARQRMPRSRRGTTTSFQVGGTEFSVIANANADGSLGEVFAKFGKAGSTTAGLMELLSAAISVGLQHGVPLETFVAKFKGQRFEPMGMTDDPDIPNAASVGDYLARRLAHDWLDVDARAGLDLLTPAEEAALPADAYAPTPLHPRTKRPEAAASN